jgi:iron complex outermembrane recepter protein
MSKFKINPLVLAIAVAMPTAVHAQTKDDAVEEIVISGFRASQAKALDAKRDAAGSVDAIMASDIAEFPDNNLAESLQRIPGVAIARSGGEGRSISVRGLGPNFTRVLINGMEGISTTGGTDATGGNNRGRGFDFNTFSSDLFNSLTVRKTGSAEIDEGSLGATVDMKAASPFDSNGFVFTANGQLGYNDLSKEKDPSGGFLISNVFADGKVGALLSYSYGERSILDQGNSTVRWSNAAGEKFGKYKGVAISATDPITTSFHPRIPRYDSYETNLSREGLSGSIQFRPTDATEISLDALLSKYEATRTEKFLQASLNGSQNANVNIYDYEIVGKTLAYASMTGVRLLAESRQDEMTTDFSQYTLSAKHDFTDSFRVSSLVGTSKSDFDNPIQNTIIMQADNQDFIWDYRNGDGRLTFGDKAFNKSNWSINSVRQRPQGTENTYDTGAIRFEYDINDSLTLKGGASTKEFAMDTFQEAYLGGEALGNAANCARTGNTTAANTPSPTCGVNLLSSPTFMVEYDSGLGQDRPWILPNRAEVMNNFGLWNKPMAVTRGSTFKVTEETQAEYLQLDFKTEVAGLPVRGDIGVRHFTTDQSSTSWVNIGGVFSQVLIPHSYSDTLPSVNIVVEPIEDVQVRASYSEGIARAGLGSLVGETNVTVTGTNRSVSSGNPFLKPTQAKSYDLGVEWYFAEESAISFALFRKELSTQVQSLVGSAVFTTLGLPNELAINACGPAYGPNCNENLEWNTTTPVNGPGGPLDGYEISYQQPFTFLPGFLKNFGFTGSYTHVDAKMDYVNAKGEILSTASLINLSPSTSSATIYYEQDAFKARVSVAKRAGYLTVATNDANLNYQNGTNATTNVDAQVSYQINDNFKVTLDMLNLTNEIDDQWVDEADQRLSYVHETGRQFNLGVNYKF